MKKAKQKMAFESDLALQIVNFFVPPLDLSLVLLESQSKFVAALGHSMVFNLLRNKSNFINVNFHSTII
jgi:hypothetical protein